MTPNTERMRPVSLREDKPALTIDDLVDMQAPHYREARSRINALLAQLNDGAKMNELSLQLNGSCISSHRGDDLLIAAHALQIDEVQLMQAITEAESKILVKKQTAA